MCLLFSDLMKNTVYAYPDVWVCLYDTFGCDTREQEEECRDSATMTEGGNASAVFYPGGEFEQEVPVVGMFTTDVSTLGVLVHACRARRVLASVCNRLFQTMALAIESLPGETVILWMTVIRAPLREPLRACICPQKGWCLEYKTSQVTRFLEQERNAEYFLDYFILNVSCIT